MNSIGSKLVRSQADRLLKGSLTDVDGNIEERKGATSVFNGPPPLTQAFDKPEQEVEGVAAWLRQRIQQDGVAPHEIGIFARSGAQLERAKSAASCAVVSAKILGDTVEIAPNHASIGTMHLAKGLEFRAVVVMACDDEVIPSEERIEAAADDVELEEVYNTERHLLYVACTRARDFLLVSGVTPVSEFLDDLAAKHIASNQKSNKAAEA